MKSFLIFVIFAAAVMFAACGGASEVRNTPHDPELVSVEKAHQAVKDSRVQFVDVRTVEEFAAGHAVGTQNLPVETISENLASLDKSKPVYLICRTGRRSANAAKILAEAGFTDVYDVKGGTVAWTEAGLPMDNPQ